MLYLLCPFNPLDHKIVASIKDIMGNKQGIAFMGFWMLFLFYFVFVHPCIIYYNTYHTSLNTADGKLALFFLFSSFVLWGIVLGFTFWLILKNGLLAKRNLAYIQQHGKDIKGVIRNIKPVNKSKSGILSQEIRIELNNFSGETIQHNMLIQDSRPDENRFNIGKTIHLKVDPDFKRNPYYILEGIKGKVNYVLFLIWAIFLTAVLCYYSYAYTSENGGYGWRFLELFHPLLVIPACIIFFVGLIYFIFKTFLKGKNSQKQQLKLIFWGIKTTATINEVQQTGTYINQQPQVKYTLTFTDQQGKSRQLSTKEIVSIMDIGYISSVKNREVIYLPEDPNIFDFFDKINN